MRRSVTIFFFYFVAFTNGASTHGGREREEDGAFSPHIRVKEHAKHFRDNDEEGHDSNFDHEAILGSHKEVREYDELPPSEAKKRLQKLALKMDRNGDQMIDRQELNAWVLRSFKMLSQESSDERFQDQDINKDGIITWKEYVEEEFDGLEENEDLDSDLLSELSLMEEDKILFDAADVNGDGSLDSEEFVAFTHPEDNPDLMRNSVLMLAKKSKDSNHDGVIDFQEFVGVRGEGQEKEWLMAEKDRFDEDLDNDGDGVLNDAEIVSWIIPSNEDIAQQEVDHLFASSDDDHDNVLSMGEILEHHDIFVGSEATDYGEHLHNIHKFVEEL